MKVTEVLKLLDQGFTADEIRAMEGAADPEQAPEPTPEPAPEPAKKTAAEQFTELFTGLTAKVDQLTKAVQASNIRLASGGKAPEPESVEDIINSLFEDNAGEDK